MDSEPLLLAVYLAGRRQGRQDLLPALADARRERDAALAEARTDALTGLRNRWAAQYHLQAAALGGAHLWVALVDVRALKALNDTHGFHAGDRALRDVAAVLSSVAEDPTGPAGMMVFRVGGDEFAVTLHDDADPGLPERTAGLIHAGLVEYGAAHPDRHQPEVAIGWAASREDLPEGGLLEAAGIALAHAKQIDVSTTGGAVRSVRYPARPLARRADTPDHPRIPDQRGPATEHHLARRHSA